MSPLKPGLMDPSWSRAATTAKTTVSPRKTALLSLRCSRTTPTQNPTRHSADGR